MIKNFLSDDEPERTADTNERPASAPPSRNTLGLFDSIPDDPLVRSPITPADTTSSDAESSADTIRQSGMAYSAGIAFTAAVIFMLILGWGADVLLGTSPWGIVAGILLGSIIGFIQFFRITSQIFKK